MDETNGKFSLTESLSEKGQSGVVNPNPKTRLEKPRFSF